jgi:hypothetical protein
MADSKTFEEIIKPLSDNQKTYIMAKALGATERTALIKADIKDGGKDQWERRNPEFVEAMQYIKAKSCRVDALAFYMGDRLPVYLDELNKLATSAEISDKVKLDALKYCISLASQSSASKELEQTTMEKYILENGGEGIITRTVKLKGV